MLDTHTLTNTFPATPRIRVGAHSPFERTQIHLMQNTTRSIGWRSERKFHELNLTNNRRRGREEAKHFHATAAVDVSIADSAAAYTATVVAAAAAYMSDDDV